ncbi:hypothetical protein J7L48_07975 [bacterium]|nr:hypothetical protein [bacterium]
MSYKRIFEILNLKNVKYLIVGGLAVNLYGVPRLTYDLDMIVENNPKNYERLIEALNQLKFSPKLPMKLEELTDKAKREEWIKDKNLIAFCVLNNDKPYEELDIILSHNIDFKVQYEKKVDFDIEEVIFPVISIDGLIKMKSYSKRKQDLQDIKMLEKIKIIINGK